MFKWYTNLFDCFQQIKLEPWVWHCTKFIWEKFAYFIWHTVWL